MDLAYTGKYEKFQAEVRDFLDKHSAHAPRQYSGNRRPDAALLKWQAILIEHGYAARTVPVRFGGFGAQPDVLETAIISDEFSRANVSTGLVSMGMHTFLPTLLEVGTEEQRMQYVGPTIRGELMWAQGYSEPGGGSDLASLNTRGVVEGDELVINGQKIWVSGADYANMMFMLCRTEPDLPRYQAISYVMLRMDTPGVEVRPLKGATGRIEFNEVFFTEARVPLSQIVLGRGRGWEATNVTLKHERKLLGTSSRMMLRLQRTVDLLQRTVRDGHPLIEVPHFQERLLRLQGEALAWRAHQMRLLTSVAKDEDPGIGGLIVKLGGTVLNWRLSALAVDAMDASGLAVDATDPPAEIAESTNFNIDYFYDIGMMIGGGTTNVQKNIIGERGLGLPRDPRPGS